MKKILWIMVLSIIIVMISTGCTALPTPSRMIKAPETVEQSMKDNNVEGIVSKFLPKDGKLISPKYPKGVGPIQSVDIDDDGEKELLATYRVNGVKLEVVAVLFRENDGKWEEQWKIESPGYEFDWLELTDLTGSEQKELLIGVDSTGGDNSVKGAKIFLLGEGAPKEIYSTLYRDMEVIHSDKANGAAGRDGLALWFKPGPFGSTVDAYKLEQINGEYILMADSQDNLYFKKNILPQYEAKMDTLAEFHNTWIYFYHYASIMLKDDNPGLALGAVENALDRVENDNTGARVGILLLKAKAYNAIGNSKAAATTLEKALSENNNLEESELAPGYEALLYLEMSNTYGALKDLDNGEAYYKKAVEAGKRACNSKAYINAAQAPDTLFFRHFVKIESIEKDFKAKFIFAIEKR